AERAGVATMKARHAAVLVSILACLVALAPGAAQQRGTEVLAARVADVIRAAELGDQVGVSVADATTGREIFQLRGDKALNPASNMKVATAATALDALGPNFTMLTGLYGRNEGGRGEHLVLRGFGDPSLGSANLHAMAEELAESGVRPRGTIHVDGSYF